MRKTLNEVKLRIDKLSIKPIVNASLIKKWQRIYNKLVKES